MERADLSPQIVPDLVRRLYGLTITHQEVLNSYDDVNILVLTEGASHGEPSKQCSTNGYVLKVLNSVDSMKENFVGAMHDAIARVSRAGVITPGPVQTMDGEWYSMEPLPSATRPGTSTRFLVRLFHFIPGELLQAKPYTADLCWQVGQLAGQLDEALKDFTHAGLVDHNRHWNLSQVEHLGDKIPSVTAKDDQQLVTDVMDAFTNHVMHNDVRLQRGVIHGDLNEGNILVRPGVQNNYSVHGVLDFGDLVHEYHVFEVAIAMMYMMMESTMIDPIDAGGHVLAGYLSVFNLPLLDLGLIKECVCGRFAQSLVYGAFEHAQNPANTYCLATATRGWPLLRCLWETPKSELYRRWQEVLNSREIKVCLK